ncbi:hypothetical protein [Sorangium sp. So ce176]|uniref:hypothetical protein n=1 Tax=Sorangium sp. So ce176 TaxID=3133286 RepID=UPI003F635747
MSQALGGLPGLLAVRPLIAERLPTHDVGLVDRLETYALAAGRRAASRSAGAAEPGPQLTQVQHY